MNHIANAIVKKYGGATLSTPDHIKSIARELAQSYQRGEKLVVIVSAMGQTTNDLIRLARQVSTHPKRREMDMLLTTGERISMSLLSMALNNCKIPAISLTGSQAGVLTDDDHLNASIQEVLCPRVEKHLNEGKVVVIAGFQGVSPKTKEITTLGRGGSDTTAVAMAAAIQAHHCEILKDVAGIYSADPKICESARPIKKLNFGQILEMTFWGAKVLHYRSVELAVSKNVNIYIGPAHHKSEGTWVTGEESSMYESSRILSINSHRRVLALKISNQNLNDSLRTLEDECRLRELPFPQILTIEMNDSPTLYFTAPDEILNALMSESETLGIESVERSSVSATCTGATNPKLIQNILDTLSRHQILPQRIWYSGMTCTALIDKSQTLDAIKALHQLL